MRSVEGSSAMPNTMIMVTTTSRDRPPARIVPAAFLMIALLAACAAGQSARTTDEPGAAPPEPPAEPAATAPDAPDASDSPAPPPDLLAGPTVREAPDGPAAPIFGEGGPRQRRTINVPPVRWLAIYRRQELGDDQREAVRALLDAFELALRGFRREHAPELRELRASAQQGSGDTAELRLRIRELEAHRPKFSETQQALWNLLDTAQQERFERQLDVERAAIVRRQREREARAAGEMSSDRPTEQTPERMGPPERGER